MMLVTQICIARYHHFHLARELYSRKLLNTIYTGYPSWKLNDEDGLPKSAIHSNPLYVLPFMFLERYRLWPSRFIRDYVSWISHQHLDRYVSKKLTPKSILVSFCGSGLYSGIRAKELGGVYICDKGSTHISTQESLLAEEFSRYNINYKGIFFNRKEKELLEYDEADYITVPSSFSKQTYIDQGISESKLRVINYGARISRFEPHPTISRVKPTKDRFNVLFVGQFGARKGALDILQAFDMFKHPHKKLVLVGSILPEAKSLLDRYAHLSIDVVGRVSNKLLPSYYQNANALLLPSIEEGLAIVMGEAMACGCPVIASPNTGAEDLYTDQKEGFIVPIHSPDIIADKLNQLADCPDLYANIRANCIDRVRSIGGWTDYGNKWAEFLYSLSDIVC